MNSKSKLLLSAAVLSMLLCSCSAEAIPEEYDADAESEVSTQGEVFADETTEEAGVLSDGYDEKNSDETASNDPASKTDLDLYWKLHQNAMNYVSEVAGEMADKRWENIMCEQGFQEKYNQLGCWKTEEEENALLMYTLEASVNRVYLIIPIIFTEEYPNGKISRIIYTGGGRDWNPPEGELQKNEIADAYHPDLWATMYSY